MDTKIQGSGLFRGFLCAQGAAAIAVILVAYGVSEGSLLKAALWSAAIAVVPSTWAGFQLWLHPRNQMPSRLAGAAVRAEIGRMLITLLMFYGALKSDPTLAQKAPAATMLGGYFIIYLAGAIWLARVTGGSVEAELMKHRKDND